MRAFVVELYLSREDGGGADAVATSIRSGVSTRGYGASEVRFLNAIFIPDDETCLIFLEARSMEDVDDVLRAAGIPAGRIAEALTAGGSSPLAG
jgi:hypothetical protein